MNTPVKTRRKIILESEHDPEFETVPEKRRLKKKFGIWVHLLMVLVIWFGITAIISVNSWKAVFLDNNQVYFGKFIDKPFSDSITLRQVYYVKNDTATGSSAVIGPLSDMPHAPQNQMTIMKDHILYYEALQPGSSLVTELSKDKSK